jgi:hypothetical protein
MLGRWRHLRSVTSFGEGSFCLLQENIMEMVVQLLGLGIVLGYANVKSHKQNQILEKKITEIRSNPDLTNKEKIELEQNLVDKYLGLQ